MIVAAAGHRPDKLGGYGRDAFDKLVLFARSEIARLVLQAEKGCDNPVNLKMITGMALGWDMAIAEAAFQTGTPFIAAVPFTGQDKIWPEESRKLYWSLIERAENVVLICEGGFAAWKMQKRNEWMVDNSNSLLALWNNSPGGTMNCVKYACKVGRDVQNCWSRWATFQT